MLDASKEVETAMIITGLAAGGIAVLLFIMWLCALLSFTRRKHLEVIHVLPTTSSETIRRDNAAERNAALLKALSKFQKEVPLPPPSSLVPSHVSDVKQRKRVIQRKRTHSEVEVRTKAGSWKVSLETESSERPEKARSIRSSKVGSVTVAIAAETTFHPPSDAESKTDPFSCYDRQYETAFVQRELASTANATARWKICARIQRHPACADQPSQHLQNV